MSEAFIVELETCLLTLILSLLDGNVLDRMCIAESAESVNVPVLPTTWGQ